MISTRSTFNSPCRLLALWGRAFCLAAVTFTGLGCAAITNPVADGIPVSRLPDELRGKSRAGMKNIDLTMLRQKPIDVHLVGPGDILGIVIQSVLGGPNETTPVRFGDGGQGGGTGAAPALGYPILVQDDGTIALPYIEPIKVEGMTLVEVQQTLIKAYTVDRKVLVQPRILVTLMQARRYHVLVMREDGGSGGVPVGPAFGSTPLIGASKRGTGFQLDLPIGENDVLNALARTGGLPGTDAKNEVVIYKKSKDKTDPTETVIRIPLRIRPNDPPAFKPSDVLLGNGDIVYLESRDTEVFYTAGLLGSGQYPLPRDIDLDVIQAVTYIRGPLLNGGFGQAQFVANVTNPGLGQESPSRLTILRKTASGRQLPIKVDLNIAMKDPRERINILPGDILVLQESPGEAVGRYISQTLRFSIFARLVNENDLQITTNPLVP